MKIEKNHYDELKCYIETYYFTNKEFCDNYKKEVSLTRFMFDLFQFSGALRHMVKELYKYLNDDNIETALKKIFKEIEQKKEGEA